MSLFVLQVEHELPVDVTHSMNLQAFVRFAAVPGFEVEAVRMQRADDLVGSDETLGKRTLPMRAAILCRKDAAVTLPEYRDFLAGDDITPALSKRDGSSAA